MLGVGEFEVGGRVGELVVMGGVDDLLVLALVGFDLDLSDLLFWVGNLVALLFASFKAVIVELFVCKSRRALVMEAVPPRRRHNDVAFICVRYHAIAMISVALLLTVKPLYCIAATLCIVLQL